MLNQADNSNYSEEPTELIKREDVENTPFIIITMNDEHFGTLGNYRITEIYEDIERLRKELKEFSWNRLIQVISVMKDIDTSKELLTKN